LLRRNARLPTAGAEAIENNSLAPRTGRFVGGWPMALPAPGAGGNRTLAYLLLLLASLYAFWLLLSGFWDNTLLLGLGLVSTLLAALLGWTIERHNPRRYSLRLFYRLPAYWAWLIREIVRANLDVVKRIWLPRRYPISPTLRRLPASQRTAAGRTIYANSITLTPGTLAMEVTEHDILVHGLTRAGVAELARGAMDRKVSRVEGEPL
jgi:multicomponent Na+:H+ antiporter subunit E